MRSTTTSLRDRRPSAIAGVADLDVTPVMNMFIILIPFLISMTAFAHLASHELNLPGDEGSAHSTGRQELPLTVAVGVPGLIVVQGDMVLAELPRREDKLDLTELARLLSGQTSEKLVVAVDDPIATAEVVACLDACRAGGFSDVALAAGTGVVLNGEAGQ